MRLARDFLMSDEIDGDFVKKMRKKLGFSQERFCIEFGFQTGWLSEIERNIRRNRNVKKVKRLGDALGVPTKDLYKGLNSLAECREDYRRWENALEGEQVVVRCIGLDMANGWQAVVRSINATASPEIRLEFLVMHGEKAFSIFNPPTFRMWLQQSKANIKEINDSINSWNLGTSSKIEIYFRGYSELPLIHGIHAKKGPKERWWITHCEEIKGPNASGWSWGEDSYYMTDIEGDPRVEDFNSRFDRLWRSSEDKLIERTILPRVAN